MQLSVTLIIIPETKRIKYRTRTAKERADAEVAKRKSNYSLRSHCETINQPVCHMQFAHHHVQLSFLYWSDGYISKKHENYSVK